MTDDLTALRKLHENARTYGQATVDVPTRSLGALLDRLEHAEAAIERVRGMAEEMGETIGFDRLVHGQEAEYPVSYFREKLDEALAPLAAIDTGKETGE